MQTTDYAMTRAEITIDRPAYESLGANKDYICAAGRIEPISARHAQFSGIVGEPSYRSIISDLHSVRIPRQTPSGHGNTTLIPGFTLERLEWAGTALLERDFQRHAVERAIGGTSKMPDHQRAGVISLALIESYLDYIDGSPAFERAIKSVTGKCAVLIRSIRVNHPAASVPDIMGVLSGLSAEQIDAAVACVRSGEQSAGEDEHQRNGKTDPRAHPAAKSVAEIDASAAGEKDQH